MLFCVLAPCVVFRVDAVCFFVMIPCVVLRVDSVYCVSCWLRVLCFVLSPCVVVSC